jgi:hypothetical protein
MHGVIRASITRAKDHAIAKFATALRDADLANAAWERGFKDGYRAGLRDARTAARGSVNPGSECPRRPTAREFPSTPA